MSAQSRAHKLTFAKLMVSKLETALQSGATVVSIQTDGISTSFNRDQAIRELEMWRKQVIRYSKKRSRLRSINMGGSND